MNKNKLNIVPPTTKQKEYLLFNYLKLQSEMNFLLITNIIIWPFVLFVVLALTVVAIMIGFSWFLGERGKGRLKDSMYESGIKTTGSARLRFPSKFYLIAMFFVLFDIEAVFVIAWAIAFRELGWTGYIGIFIFIAILLIILIYEWRIGALDYAISGRELLNESKKKEKL